MNLGDVEGGYDTARLHSVAGEDAARRDHTRATARATLAAWVCEQRGIDPRSADPDSPAVVAAAAEFGELADALGLRTNGGSRD